MLLQDTVRLVVEAEGHGRVCLESHSLAVTVQIDSGYPGIFKGLQGLAAYNGGQDRDLHLIQFLSLGLVETFLGPERVILLLEAVEDFTDLCRPIHLVGVRKDHRKDILRCKSIWLKKLRRIQSLGYGG